MGDPEGSAFNVVREVISCTTSDGRKAVVWLPNYCDACHSD